MQVFFKDLYEDNTIINVKPFLDKFGCCFVNGHTYSSDYNSTDRGISGKTVFVLKDENELHPYFGVVRFFFRCYVRLIFSMEGIENDVMKDTILAYVTWMTFAMPEINAMNGLYVVKNSFYERDRIISPR